MMPPDPPSRDQGRYRIRVAGHLDERWSAWFDGVTLTLQADGTTVIDAPDIDQAALHGLLLRIRDGGLQLISVARPEIDDR
jgi:hypothetical protein